MRQSPNLSNASTDLYLYEAVCGVSYPRGQHLLPQQGVDQGGLAAGGPPEEDDLGWGGLVAGGDWLRTFRCCLASTSLMLATWGKRRLETSYTTSRVVG